MIDEFIALNLRKDFSLFAGESSNLLLKSLIRASVFSVSALNNYILSLELLHLSAHPRKLSLYLIRLSLYLTSVSLDLFVAFLVLLYLSCNLRLALVVLEVGLLLHLHLLADVSELRLLMKSLFF